MMESPVATVAANATLRSAARALREGEVGTLVIMGGDDIVGIVSERDVVRALADDADPDDVWVADVMSASPRYLTKGESVTSAVEIMLTAGIRHLPVVDEGELVGIVSMRDLARRLLD
jgi:CBS domain-containing protein